MHLLYTLFLYSCFFFLHKGMNLTVNVNWPWMNETINTGDDKAECMSHAFLLNYGKWTLILRSLSAFHIQDWSNLTLGICLERMSTRARNSPRWTSWTLGLVCECVCVYMCTHIVCMIYDPDRQEQLLAWCHMWQMCHGRFQNLVSFCIFLSLWGLWWL